MDGILGSFSNEQDEVLMNSTVKEVVVIKDKRHCVHLFNVYI